MYQSHPLTTRFLILLALPLAVVVALAFGHLRASLPEVRGRLEVAGIAVEVTIARDEHGVPRIRAASDREVFFAVGYVHAQDRLWQLELQRRMAQGRLSEVFGKDNVEHDVWLRTLGLYRQARSAWDALSPEAQASLQAYADGVNAWLDGRRALPIEFVLLGIEPEPWTPLDSLAWVKMFALDLGGNFRQEIRRAVAARTLGSEHLQALFYDYPQDAPTPVAAAASLDPQALVGLLELQHDLETEWALGGRYVGSNAWVVAGRHTSSGRAMLANDTHLGLQIPSLWYALDLKGDRLRASGMGLVGLPIVVFGRNRHLSWGGTNMTADVQDLYLERVDPEGSAYQLSGRWLPIEARVETIAVKPDFPAGLREPLEPVRVVVRSTRHGPVISDYFGVFEQPVALRWTALEPGDTSYEAFFRLNYAGDWDSFRAALSVHVAPVLNFLYADDQGNIGYLGAGRIPVRRRGSGTVPVPGWDDEHDWEGYVPVEDWPQSLNPESGYLVSANHRSVGPDYPYFISSDWAPPDRAQRIEQLLRAAIEGGRKLDQDAMARMQADTLSLPAARLARYLVDNYRPRNWYQEQAFKYLSTWDGDMRSDSQAATIFNAWSRHLRHQLFDDELAAYWGSDAAGSVLRELTASIQLDELYHALTASSPDWCDNVDTDAVESCDETLHLAFNAGLWEVFKMQGDKSMESWRWGDVHRTRYRHFPFSSVKGLSTIFERRIENGGSPDSINVAGAKYAASQGYLQYFGAGFRQLMEPGEDTARHLYMNSTGQSGNLMSPHYDDMVEPFRDAALYRLDAPPARLNKLILSPVADAGGGAAQ